MALAIDTSTEFGARVARHLTDDQIVWLATTDAHGGPQPKPVYFVWEEGGTVLIYTGPGLAKIRHIGRNSRVALNFNSTPQGFDVVVLTGTAAIVADAPRPDRNPAYVAKNAAAIQHIGMTPETFGDAYPIAIRVTPDKLRGE